ncbi:helix-turn-helix domain-containing protein [Halopseudomonas pachastrellae]|nr:helix-turn-helix domain-containing protein [Halopseudomonas pachastrellae]
MTELAEEQQEPWLLVRAFSHLNYTEAFLATTYLGNARTLCDAISLSKRYFHQNSDLASLALELNSGQARIVVTPTPEAHATEQQLVAALYAVMRTCQGLGLQQASANLAGMSDSAQDACRRLLRLPVTAIPGEQRLELQFPALELARALNTTQPNIARLARRERQLIRSTAGHCWSESVQLLLTALLPRGETRISRCASLLAVAPRTLQRKLTTEQQPFSALLATVRQRLCLEYLRADHADDTLALLLGYRQTSQFYRQFRQWYGCSPSQLRSRLTPEIAKTTKTRDATMRRHTLLPALLLPLALAANAADDSLDERLTRGAEAIQPKAIAWRHDIHQHPELGNQEQRTAALIAEHLRSLGMEVATGVGTTGVVGLLKGGKPGPVVALARRHGCLAGTGGHSLPFASEVRQQYLGEERPVSTPAVMTPTSPSSWQPQKC